ncbi:MAG: asparaginase [Clostridia bacterium]|nr:asparaginase [Clostridia bacterium]
MPIALLATGGTIASAPTAHGLAPAMAAQELISHLPQEQQALIAHCEDVFSLDSTNIQPEEWRRLAQAVDKALSTYDGVVITHGTDTMAYTAAALTFMLQGLKKPVILTGSQLPMGAPLSDAPGNLSLAVEACRQGVPGVYVAFNRKVISGVRVVKTRTTSFDAFDSVNAPLSGLADSEGVRFTHPQPTLKEPYQLMDKLDPRVFLLKLMPGTLPDVMDFAVASGYRGMVIEAFGLGGLHYIRRNLVDKLKLMAQHGIYVLVVTQCLYEKADFSIYEVGSRVLSDYVLSGRDMTTEAAVTKMMWALGQNDPGRWLKENLAGEFR